jgi:hypothetical protein
MDAAEHIPFSSKTSLQRQMLGGDRFYNLSRWGVMALLIGIVRLISGEPLWPPSAAQSPMIVVMWGYVLFTSAYDDPGVHSIDCTSVAVQFCRRYSDADSIDSVQPRSA